MSVELDFEMKETQKKIHRALNSVYISGIAYAEAEKNYRIELCKQILIERDKSTPVTIINDVCRGHVKVAELKFKRDEKRSLYEASVEAVNVYKLDIRILDEAIKREWNTCK